MAAKAKRPAKSVRRKRSHGHSRAGDRSRLLELMTGSPEGADVFVRQAVYTARYALEVATSRHHEKMCTDACVGACLEAAIAASVTAALAELACARASASQVGIRGDIEILKNEVERLATRMLMLDL